MRRLAMARLALGPWQKQMGRGQTDIRHLTDMATIWLTRPRGPSQWKFLGVSRSTTHYTRGAVLPSFYNKTDLISLGGADFCVEMICMVIALTKVWQYFFFNKMLFYLVQVHNILLAGRIYFDTHSFFWSNGLRVQHMLSQKLNCSYSREWLP